MKLFWGKKLIMNTLFDIIIFFLFSEILVKMEIRNTSSPRGEKVEKILYFFCNLRNGILQLFKTMLPLM